MYEWAPPPPLLIATGWKPKLPSEPLASTSPLTPFVSRLLLPKLELLIAFVLVNEPSSCRSKFGEFLAILLGFILCFAKIESSRSIFNDG